MTVLVGPRLSRFTERARAWSRVTARLLRARYLFAAFLALIVLMGIFAPLIAPDNPNAIDILNRLAPPVWARGGSMAHIFGTDELGRDILSRVMFGARTSVTIGVVVVAIGMTTGTAAGLLAGYRGGWVDTLIMRIVDVQFSFPALLMAMAIVFALGASATTLIIVLSLDAWLPYCRLGRSMVLTVRHTTYVEAARSIGCHGRRLVLKHILPNVASPLVTLAVLEFARIVLAEATLSFLGLGIQPPLVSWGLMLNTGEDYLTVAWWLITIPGLFLTLTVLSANMVASWLRTAADPLQKAGAKQ
jgi:ABC-type dipeptide/oligopeptide/nickel transport system permease subunit